MKLTGKLSLLLTIHTLLISGPTAGFVILGLSHQITDVFWPLLLGGLIIALLLVLIMVLHQQITQPIHALTEAVARISLGDLSQPVAVASHDELGALSQSFNHMTQQLSSTQRKLEASSQVAKDRSAQLQSSINSLRQGFIMVDLKNQIILANTAAVDITYGTDSTSAKARPKLELETVAKVLPHDFDFYHAITQATHTKNLAKFPALPLRGRFLNLYLSPVISDDRAIGCVLLLEDVTEERILQRSRDEFFSIASHELRTPLTAIRGNTSMLEEYFPQALKDPEVKSMIADIHNSAERLIGIVNDFLNTSSLEQNKMKFQFAAFALDKIIEKIIYEMSNVSRNKHITLAFDHSQLDTLPLVYADPSRITQVLYNLVGNAMKFSAEGRIIINCLVEGSFIKVCVSDTGQGISPEGQQLLFHKFQQSTNSILTRDNTRGTGLGLYISKLLVERMKGTIQLEHSEVGKGSVFSFTVPVATPAQIKAAQQPATPTVSSETMLPQQFLS